MSRLQIDSERCTGHGRCYDLAPELFEPDEYGHGVVIEPDPADGADALAAALNCPERAIHFVTDPG
jgi:ferredoxin